MDRLGFFYYNENDEYEEWREYRYHGKYVFLRDNQGNERYIRTDNVPSGMEIEKRDYDEASFLEANNPDIFKFELMEL